MAKQQPIEYKGHSVMPGTALYEMLTDGSSEKAKLAQSHFTGLIRTYNQLAGLNSGEHKDKPAT